jgi:hypothetical protein
LLLSVCVVAHVMNDDRRTDERHSPARWIQPMKLRQIDAFPLSSKARKKSITFGGTV